MKQAGNLDFLIMKGERYVSGGGTWRSALSGLSSKANACVHRSPDGEGRGHKRVSLGVDLATGGDFDDREWLRP